MADLTASDPSFEDSGCMKTAIGLNSVEKAETDQIRTL